MTTHAPRFIRVDADTEGRRIAVFSGHGCGVFALNAKQLRKYIADRRFQGFGAHTEKGALRKLEKAGAA